MILTITSALALFMLILISTVVFYISKRFKLPYTVLLVFVGLLLVQVVNLPYLEHIFGFLDDMVLTPELLFYIFLPVLIFESAFNMKIRKMLDSAWAISLLSVVSLVVSTVTIAALLFYALPLIGVNMPFIMALLFGAVISPTDPVAVLSLFKEVGVPKRLAMIFEGESLFNDGTAVALFLVILAVATDGYHGVATIGHGVFEFMLMIALGIVIGLVMAAACSKALKFTKKNEFVTVTLLLISAHLVFITAELINHSGVVHVSSIIATTVAALFLGNYSRNVLAPKIDNYLHKLLEHMTFVINSLVFLMAGLLFASSGVHFFDLWLPIVVTVLIVAFARVIAVFAVTKPLNMLKLENEIPMSWQKLLAWASLRGALSIIIVLIIPADFTVDGWNSAYTPREFLLALTIGCILATLFIKAPFISTIMRRNNINTDDSLKEAYECDLAIYYLLAEKNRLLNYKTRGFIDEENTKNLTDRIEEKIADTKKMRQDLVDKHGLCLFEQSLHLSMIHVEKYSVKKLFINEEVSEKVYRKIYSKLCLQQEKIELAQHDAIDPKAYMDRKDIFDRLVMFIQNPFNRSADVETLEQRLEYYRAQMIMARKAVDTIEKMQNEYGQPVFIEEPFAKVSELYRTYRDRSGLKADILATENAMQLNPHIKQLAERSLASSGVRALAYLNDRGLVDEETEEDIIHHFSPKPYTHTKKN